jgi:hypothetical protein
MPTAPLSDLARRSELAHCQPASRGPPAFVKVLKGNVGFIPSNNDAPLSQRRAPRRWVFATQRPPLSQFTPRAAAASSAAARAPSTDD